MLELELLFRTSARLGPKGLRRLSRFEWLSLAVALLFVHAAYFRDLIYTGWCCDSAEYPAISSRILSHGLARSTASRYASQATFRTGALIRSRRHTACSIQPHADRVCALHQGDSARLCPNLITLAPRHV